MTATWSARTAAVLPALLLFLTLDAVAEAPKGQLPDPQAPAPKRQIRVPQDLPVQKSVQANHPLFAMWKGARDHRDEIPQSASPPVLPAALTVMVPVTVKRLRVHEMKVMCRAGHGPDSSPLQNVVGDGERRQALVNGSFNGTVPVPVKPRGSGSAQDMKSYDCMLMLPDDNGTFASALYNQDVDRQSLRYSTQGAIP